MSGEPGDAIQPIDIIRAIRADVGISMMDAKAAMQKADERFGGDYLLAALMRHAHGFAINVRSRDPEVSPAAAREDWDLRHALTSRDGSQSDERAALKRLCRCRWDPNPALITQYASDEAAG